MARDLPPGKRIAVVLFNLGGPDGPKAVRPFLFNLFADPAIIQLPVLARLALATLISTTRAKSARANYAIMGGGSPLLPETQKQAQALADALAGKLPGASVRCFIAMRYWHPLTGEAAKAVADFEPDEVVLLPLYAQYSTTTTESSVKAWKMAYKGSGQVHEVCCYPRLPGFIAAHAKAIGDALKSAARPGDGGPVRLLFSAHGLPEKIIKAGDPYQKQIEATAAAIVEALPKALAKDLDWQVCYQSRVGRLVWLGPSTPEAIEGAACDGLGVVVVPIAFVSEHIETLVELDHEYAELAEKLNCAPYIRVPALGIDKAFITALAETTVAALGQTGIHPAAGWTCGECGPICPARNALQAEGAAS